MPEITVHAQHCTGMLPKGDTGLVEILLGAGALSHLVDERMGHSRICHVLERGIFEKRRGPSEHHQFPPERRDSLELYRPDLKFRPHAFED